MNQSNQLPGKRIFLSYVHNDAAKVALVRNQLLEAGFQVYSDYTETEIPVGISWTEHLQYRLETSDYVLVFLSSKLFQRDGLTFSYQDEFLNNIKARNINLILVRLDSTPVPSNLSGFQLIDLNEVNFNNVSHLIQNINRTNDISFEGFSALKFEEMILELLHRLNFQNLKWDRKIHNSGFDFIAEYHAVDPFGLTNEETWVFECKFYQHARFDLSTTRKIVESYKYVQRKDAKLALITNSQFTSVVKDYLESIRNTHFLDIQTIDGFQLKNILAQQPEMVAKYFK